MRSDAVVWRTWREGRVTPRSSRRRARSTAPLGPRRGRARPVRAERTGRPSAVAPRSPRGRAALRGPRNGTAWQRRLRPLDFIAQHVSGFAFTSIDRAGSFQHLQRIAASCPSHGNIRHVWVRCVGNHHVRLTQDGAVRSADRHQSDAVAVVAAVEAAATPPRLPWPGGSA